MARCVQAAHHRLHNQPIDDLCCSVHDDGSAPSGRASPPNCPANANNGEDNNGEEKE